MYLFLKRILILKTFFFLWNCWLPLSWSTISALIITVVCLYFSIEKQKCMANESFSTCNAMQMKNKACSCSKHCTGKSQFRSRLESKHFLVVIPLPRHPVYIGSGRADKAWMEDSTTMWLAFQEGTVAVWVVQDAQWTCQGGWARSNAARVWQGPDESRSYRWRPVNQGGSWRPG